MQVLLISWSSPLNVGHSKKQEVTITICVVPLRDYCYTNFRCSSYPVAWLNNRMVRHLELWRWLVMIDWDEVGIFEEWRVENRWWWVRGGVSVITCCAWRKICVIPLCHFLPDLPSYLYLERMLKSLRVISKLPLEHERVFDLPSENFFRS
jgi:hypothetical protein